MHPGYKFFKTIVHNDAIREDPPEIYGWRVIFLVISACWGGMLFGIETGIIGGVLVLEPFKQKYGLVHKDKVTLANLSANIVSTLQAGCFLGAIIASPIADRWGRKPALLLCAAVAAVGAIMQTAAEGQLAVMYIGRFINGVGVGTASAVTPLYISENAPRAIRGLLTGCYQAFIVTGVMLAFWINYGASLHLTGKALYIVPLSMQILPCLLLFGFMLANKESARFLAKQDRWEESKRTLAAVRSLPESHPYVETEFTEIVTVIENERALVGNASFKTLMREMWLIAGNRRRALISVGLMLCQQFTGVNALNYYAPQIFKSLGVTGTRSSLFATGIYGVVKLTACLCFLLFAADSLGRRRSLFWTSFGQAFCLFYVAIYVKVSKLVDESKPSDVSPAGYAAVVFVYLFAAIFQFGWGAACWIYVSEIPTARLRATNVSLAAATQWFFNFLIARTVTTMLATMGKGGYGAYLFFACACTLMGFFVYFFIPETKGLSLEKMDELFGVTQLVGEKLRHDESAAEHVEERIHEAVKDAHVGVQHVEGHVEGQAQGHEHVQGKH